MAERTELAATFDTAADLYQSARPEYPAALLDDLIEATGIAPGARLLEIGCATGKATLPLAQRGFGLTCLEPGAALAAVARRTLADFPDVVVHESTFEDFDAAGTAPYDLVFAATSWHWVDPAVRFQRAWEALLPGGHLAFWSATHVVPTDGDPIFAELQEVYDEIGEGLPAGTSLARPGALPDDVAAIEASGCFDVALVRQYAWEVSYDADSYLRLLDTFSGHIAMQPWQRERLDEEIRARLAERADGRLRRGWGAVLHVARRRDDARPSVQA